MYKEIDHPCVQHKLSLLRHFETDYKKFRELTTEITTLMCYEALKNLNTDNITIKTPIAEADCQIISDEVVVTPILRAGLGMLEGVLNIIPTAHVGFLGMYRDEETAQPVPYYQNIPAQSSVGLNIIIDPMLATGGSMISAIDSLKKIGATNVIVICIVTCKEGISSVLDAHGNIKIYTASIDSHLNEKKYIVPGLGDAGDRLYGTY